MRAFFSRRLDATTVVSYAVLIALTATVVAAGVMLIANQSSSL
jgi:hypothetical protein